MVFQDTRVELLRLVEGAMGSHVSALLVLVSRSELQYHYRIGSIWIILLLRIRSIQVDAFVAEGTSHMQAFWLAAEVALCVLCATEIDFVRRDPGFVLLEYVQRVVPAVGRSIGGSGRGG